MVLDLDLVVLDVALAVLDLDLVKARSRFVNLCSLFVMDKPRNSEKRLLFFSVSLAARDF